MDDSGGGRHIFEVEPWVGPAARATNDDQEREEEAVRALRDLASNETGNVPVDVVVAHVRGVTSGQPWPFQRAAMEALLRRMKSARDLDVSSSAMLGQHRTRGSSSRAPRPYQTIVTSVTPTIRASCDCADFARASLGICKHVWAALDRHWPAHARSKRTHAASANESCGHITWSPLRPLADVDDPLARLAWVEGAARVGRPSRMVARMRSLFSGAGGALARMAPPMPNERLAFIEELQQADADPAASKMLRDERDRALLAIDAIDATDAIALLEGPQGIKKPLYPYQREGVLRFLAEGRLLLGDDMGLGKTAQAIAACHALSKARKVAHGLIVVPASLKGQWLREWRMFSDVPAVVVEGAPAVRAQAYRDAKSAGAFAIVGYEQVIKDVRMLRDIASDIVVLDEAQRMKNWSTKTSLSIQALQPRRRLVLTGTPMENRLDELANIISWVDDRTLAPRWRLVPAHTEYVDGKQQIGGSRDLSALRARLAPVFLRRRRADVLGKLPPRTDHNEIVPFTPAQAGAHEALNSQVRKLVAIAAKRPLTPPEFLRLMSLLTKMRIICDGLALADFEETWHELRDERVTDALLDEIATPKLVAFRALVKKLVVDEGKKIVVFSQWRRMLELAQWSVRDILDTHQLRSMFFSGQERTKRRTQNLVDFHDDPAARILFATDAGGVGLNLQHASSVVINIEPAWNPAVLEQRIGRVHRNGQVRPVEVFHLLTDGGIEARVRELVGNKRALFDGLFDGTADAVSFERSGTFLERLQRVSEVPALPSAFAAAPPAAGPEPEVAAPAVVASAAPPTAAELFSQLQVSRASDGSMTMTVPPSAAPFIAAMLRSWASALDDSSRAPT